ncbi:hypothetical protein Tco_0499777 [Tanacetum coccineum]
MTITLHKKRLTVPNIQQDPLHEFPVSVISNLTTLPTTPPPITPPLATTTEAPIPSSFKSKIITAALQQLYTVEQEVQELKQVNQSDFISEAIRTQVPVAVNKYLISTLGDTLQKTLQKHTEELRQELSQKDVSKTPKSTSKSVQAKETVFEDAYNDMPLNQGDDTSNDDEQPDVEAVTKDDWFKKPPRPPTPDPEWNTRKSVDDGPEQS